MKHKEDVLDIVMIQISNRIKSKEVLVHVSEAITATRQMCEGRNWVRHDREWVKRAYTLWMQQKFTDKTMKEIYQYIADDIGNVSTMTIGRYIKEFINGYNPHEQIEV